MKKAWFILLSAVLITPASFAQNSADALRYSRTNIGGTARFVALGGAFGALGADFTTASTNPAGIAMYRSTEISFTPSIFIGNTQSTYNGSINSDSRSNFNIGNVGLVSAKNLSKNGKSNGWKYFNFAVGLNRIDDYNNKVNLVGPNPYNSLIDSYVDHANGIYYTDIDNVNGPYGFDLSLAWWTWLLDLQPWDSSGTQYFSATPTHGVFQQKTIETKGSSNEFIFSFAGNYNDKLYLGATIGIPYLRYSEYSVYTETDLHPDQEETDPYYFKQFNRIEQLETRGSGVNFKLGLIYRANNWLRIGAAFHSPTWYTNMRDKWSATMQSFWDTDIVDGKSQFVKSSPEGNYRYSLNTPLRVQGSLGFIIGNVGLVSAEYEFTDFSKAKFSAPDYSFYNENTAIRNSYQVGHTIRVGTEWRYQVFSFRAGVNYLTSPYNNSINDGSRIGFAGGVGIRGGVFFADLAYAYNKMEEDYYLYRSETVVPNPVQNKMTTHRILLTLGVKF